MRIVTNEENHSYSLILEGSDCADAHAGERDIPIYQDDLNIITKYLNEPKIATQTQYNLADLLKPQSVEILQAIIARHEAMSDEESNIRAAAWERFKKNNLPENITEKDSLMAEQESILLRRGVFTF